VFAYRKGTRWWRGAPGYHLLAEFGDSIPILADALVETAKPLTYLLDGGRIRCRAALEGLEQPTRRTAPRKRRETLATEANWCVTVMWDKNQYRSIEKSSELLQPAGCEKEVTTRARGVTELRVRE
jgi:hypothetical protein